MSKNDLSEPLKPAMFHILLAIADQDRHGYAIMQAVREQSGGRVPIQTGSFYRHLSRLIALGLVVETAVRHPEDPRRGTHYRLTPSGRDVLERERRYLADVMSTLNRLRARKGTA
jgi:DNA-binding PadR family transcriptional regulator